MAKLIAKSPQKAQLIQTAGSGTKDYDLLRNKPQINGVILQGNLTSEDLGIESGATVVSAVVNENGSITFKMSDGTEITTTGASVIGPQGERGQDYVLTDQDKSDIADIVLSELPTTQGVLYGNTGN
jgi:hypothetical protein